MFSAISSKAKKAVSRDKYRFQDGELDLDLTYITNKIIAMVRYGSGQWLHFFFMLININIKGLPGCGVEKVWRNHEEGIVLFSFNCPHPPLCPTKNATNVCLLWHVGLQM